MSHRAPRLFESAAALGRASYSLDVHLSADAPAHRSPARAAPVLASLVACFALSCCSSDGGGGGGADDAPSATASDTTSSDSSQGAVAEAAQLVQQGLDELMAGNDDAAVSSFEEALVLDPDNHFALYNLGVVAQGAGDDEAALDYYDDAVAAQPDYVPALYNKAILVESDDIQQAIDLYRIVLALDDSNARAHLRLGMALFQVGDTEGAELHLGRAIELDPSVTENATPTPE